MAAELLAIEPEDPTQVVIEKLEEVLKLARAGELSAVAIAVVYRDGRTGARWSPSPRFASVLGAVDRLAYKLNQLQDES